MKTNTKQKQQKSGMALSTEKIGAALSVVAEATQMFSKMGLRAFLVLEQKGLKKKESFLGSYEEVK